MMRTKITCAYCGYIQFIAPALEKENARLKAALQAVRINAWSNASFSTEDLVDAFVSSHNAIIDAALSDQPSPASAPAVDAERAAMERVIEMLPGCSGEWLSGGGGHRKHGPCGRIATWFHSDDIHSYCDEHIKDIDKRETNNLRFGLEEAPWADEVRALDRLRRGEREAGK